uniref:Uncharacterized protein n=1 Tax=viral metagenome TaxID=1070528 RepID=A0A6C0JSK2_9ZZZZ
MKSSKKDSKTFIPIVDEDEFDKSKNKKKSGSLESTQVYEKIDDENPILFENDLEDTMLLYESLEKNKKDGLLTLLLETREQYEKLYEDSLRKKKSNVLKIDEIKTLEDFYNTELIESIDKKDPKGKYLWIPINDAHIIKLATLFYFNTQTIKKYIEKYPREFIPDFNKPIEDFIKDMIKYDMENNDSKLLKLLVDSATEEDIVNKNVILIENFDKSSLNQENLKGKKLLIKCKPEDKFIDSNFLLFYFNTPYIKKYLIYKDLNVKSEVERRAEPEGFPSSSEKEFKDENILKVSKSEKTKKIRNIQSDEDIIENVFNFKKVVEEERIITIDEYTSVLTCLFAGHDAKKIKEDVGNDLYYNFFRLTGYYNTLYKPIKEEIMLQLQKKINKLETY